MATYKTPGVYVEEIPTLPPSVAEVSTAVPAFIGYTARGPKNEPTKIGTLLEFETLFGRAPNKAYSLAATKDRATNSWNFTDSTPAKADVYNLYYALKMYFANGGGGCYIVSVGPFGAGTVTLAAYTAGLEAIKAVDEPTLLVAPDAVALKASDYYVLCGNMLNQCGELKDRFSILDVPANDVDGFRNSVSSDSLNFGAAYLPYLNTGISHLYSEREVSVQADSISSANLGGLQLINIGADKPKVTVEEKKGDKDFEVNGSALTIYVEVDAKKSTATSKDVEDAWQSWAKTNPAGGFSLSVSGNNADLVPLQADTALASPGTASLANLRRAQTDLYNAAKAYLANMPNVVLPPSGAMAGVYARVDRDRGVWKAPANVAVANVTGPTKAITNTDQENLNVDPVGGKSINAIRSFTGKGTLVWGARTLAGNDNEWRYVPVRRLFNMIEESIQKSTAFAVFEANDVSTWLKVKAMIESYLFGLWQQGALAGPTPESAFFINVGLGKTMTAQDILEGRLIVEVGIAAVRPAEFIVLRFSHKLQEA